MRCRCGCKPGAADGAADGAGGAAAGQARQSGERKGRAPGGGCTPPPAYDAQPAHANHAMHACLWTCATCGWCDQHHGGTSTGWLVIGPRPKRGLNGRSMQVVRRGTLRPLLLRFCAWWGCCARAHVAAAQPGPYQAIACLGRPPPTPPCCAPGQRRVAGKPRRRLHSSSRGQGATAARRPLVRQPRPTAAPAGASPRRSSRPTGQPPRPRRLAAAQQAPGGPGKGRLPPPPRLSSSNSSSRTRTRRSWTGCSGSCSRGAG